MAMYIFSQVHSATMYFKGHLSCNLREACMPRAAHISCKYVGINSSWASLHARQLQRPLPRLKPKPCPSICGWHAVVWLGEEERGIRWPPQSTLIWLYATVSHFLPAQVWCRCCPIFIGSMEQNLVWFLAYCNFFILHCNQTIIGSPEAASDCVWNENNP